MRTYLKTTIFGSFAFVILTGISCKTVTTDEVIDPIRIYSENPFYWEYKGEPVLLLGGTKEDNLFNHPEGLAEHLDKLKDTGGNYIRNTMSSRNPGNPWPHKKLANGLYDLNQWDDEYWGRLEVLLRLCLERDIIVQIEIWDIWDYFMTEAPLGYGPENVGWESCPYNPILNINYTAEESGLAVDIDYYSGSRPSEHVFFHTVPELMDIPVIREHQEAFVDRLLSISLEYPNVLYCMNNEIGEPAEWGEYWAGFVRNRAKDARKEVYLADMRRTTNFESEQQVKLLHDRTHYDFFEISQNNGNNDQRHYDMIMSIRDQVVDQPKPLNNVKIYGGTVGRWTTSVEEGTRRFWRNIFGGCASSRFHRDGPSPLFFGAGLNELAQTHIRSMRMFSDEMDIFNCIPSNHLLGNRVPNEAYCLAEEGKQYALYFPDGGEVMLNLSAVDGELELRWMSIGQSSWLKTETRQGHEQVRISTPGRGQWAVLIQPKKKE
jgi:hypothetical protein